MFLPPIYSNQNMISLSLSLSQLPPYVMLTWPPLRWDSLWSLKTRQKRPQAMVDWHLLVLFLYLRCPNCKRACAIACFSVKASSKNDTLGNWVVSIIWLLVWPSSVEGYELCINLDLTGLVVYVLVGTLFAFFCVLWQCLFWYTVTCFQTCELLEFWWYGSSLVFSCLKMICLGVECSYTCDLHWEVDVMQL